MATVYTACKEFQPPTGVEHAIQARFFHESEVNLVVAKATLLQIFRINYISVQNSPDQATNSGKDGQDQKKPVLDLAFETKLFGCIESVNVVRFPNAKRDSLIFSFREAKASVVEWDPATSSTKVTSLHYFEDDKHKDTRTQFDSIPVLKVDHENRCAAMLIYDTRLVILPFINKKMSMMFEDDIYESRKNQKQESNSYVINLKADLGIHNVKDFEFLQGYYDPTIILLHEPVLTCTGRLAATKDTNKLSVISLSLSHKSHPVIWTVEHLPYDCYELVSLPAPLSGVIVFSTNQLLYCSQNQNNTYVLALNEYGAISRKENPAQYGKFEQATVTFALDAAHYTFLNNENMLLSLKTGELFVLTLFSDARTITHMKLTKAGSSVLGSCMCTLGNDLLFLGSRMGDSLLIQYYKKYEISDNNIKNGPDDYARPEKRMKLDNPNGELAVPTQPLSQYQSLSHNEVLSQKILNDEEFESLIYKTASSSGYTPQGRMTDQDSDRTINFGFTVCDSLSSVGSVGDIAVGDSYDVASTSFTEITQKRMFEMVMCSGQGKNGAISIVQEGIRPEIITAFELSGCKGSWALRTTNDSNKYHSYLVLSKENSTMVLSTGEELEEVTEKVEFHTQGATLDVGNLSEKSLIAQIYNNGMRLLAEGKKVDEMALPEYTKVMQSSISDNYILLLTRKESNSNTQEQDMRTDLLLYGVKNNRFDAKPVNVPVEGRSVITAVSLFSDEFDFFGQASYSSQKHATKPVSAPTPIASVPMDDMDEEDLAIYGSSIAPEVKTPATSLPSQNGSHGLDSTEIVEQVRNSEKAEISERKSYCVLSRENGDLEVYTVPEFRLLFFIPHFSRGPSILQHTPQHSSHSGLFSPAKHTKEAPSFFVSTALDKQQQITEPFVVEVLMCYLDKYASNSRFPFLLALLNTGDLLIYRSTVQTNSKAEHDIPIRFVKSEHEYIARQLSGPTKKGHGTQSAPSARTLQQTFRYPRLRRFDDVADKRGAFLVGPRPAWIMCERAFVRIHGMPLDGEVTCFTPFHNVNCAKGFIYFNSKGSLKICQLSSNVIYDGAYLHRKINIRLTPHKICYHHLMRLYALVVASKIPRKLEEEYKETEYRQIASSIPVFDDKFEMRLISPQGWGTTDTFQFEDCEHVLSIKVLYLRYNQSATEDSDANILLNQNPNIPSHNPNVKDPNYILKPYLVVGTGFVLGEDATTKGRIVIFDIIPPENQYHDPDSTELPKHKLKLVYQKEFKGPVSVVEHVSGFLLMNIGPKIVLYNFGTANDLVGLAFYDAQIFIVSAVAIKNYILCADVYKSIFFLRWKEEERQLVLLAKDYVPLGVFAAEFLLSNSVLTFLVNDENKNLSIFMYLPQSTESRGGQMLVCRSDFHLGSYINRFVRVPLNSLHREGTKQAAFFGTLDGSIGCVAPVDEVVFKRLFHLQSKMTLALPHFAGLNPKAFRMPRSKKKLLRNTYQNMLDGNLLWKFVSLEFTEQRKLARQIGTTPDQILDNLLEIDLSTSVFQ